MAWVLFSLGSNAERRRRIGAALSAMHQAFGPLQVSRVFESRPVGFESPHNFYNLVVGAHIDWPVARLSAWCKGVERDNGRDHSAPRFSARSLDIDILTVDDLTGVIDGVSLPREEIDYNAFVLRPLAESFGDQRHPRTRERYAVMWQRLDTGAQRLWPIDFDWRGRRLSSASPRGSVTLAPALVE